MDKYKAIVNIPAWAREMFTEGDKVVDTASAYRNVPLIYRAVKLRADSLSSVPIKLMSGEKEKPWPFLSQPEDIIWHIESSLLLSGNAFCEIARNRVATKNIIPINPFGMTVQYAKGVYTFKQESSGAVWQNIPAEDHYEILYLHEYNPTNDIGDGVGAVRVALTDAQLMRYMSRFAARFFEGGAMPVTLLGVEDAVSEEEQVRVQSFFKRAATGIANAFRVLALRGEIKPQVLTQPIKDLAMEELYEQAKRNICQAFGIPQTMLDDAANFATAKEHAMQFWQNTVRPRGRLIENAFNNQVFSQMKDKLVMAFSFDELDVFQEDEAQRSGSLLKLVNSGVPVSLAMEILGYDLTEEQKAVMVNKPEEEEHEQQEPPIRDELKKWERFALNGLGKKRRAFTSTVIPPAMYAAIDGALEVAKSADAVKRIFYDAEKYQSWELY